MAARAPNFRRQSCGAAYARWAGRCEACGAWNTLVEEGAATPGALPAKAGYSLSSRSKAKRTKLRAWPPASPSSIASRAAAWCPARCCCSAAIPASANRRLLFEVAAAYARAGHRAVYISGEEAVAQVRMRADRLGLSRRRCRTRRRDLGRGYRRHALARRGAATSRHRFDPDHVDAYRRSAPGTVTQVRASAPELIRFAKRSGTAVILVGHVTKDGQIAGPRVVEHMVDAVLYFEGDARISSAFCARSKTASAPPTKSACSR